MLTCAFFIVTGWTCKSQKKVSKKPRGNTLQCNMNYLSNRKAYQKFRCAQAKVMSNDMQIQGASVLTELCSDKAYPAPRKSEILPDKVSVVTHSTALSLLSTIC